MSGTVDRNGRRRSIVAAHGTRRLPKPRRVRRIPRQRRQRRLQISADTARDKTGRGDGSMRLRSGDKRATGMCPSPKLFQQRGRRSRSQVMCGLAAFCVPNRSEGYHAIDGEKWITEVHSCPLLLQGNTYIPDAPFTALLGPSKPRFNGLRPQAPPYYRSDPSRKN